MNYLSNKLLKMKLTSRLIFVYTTVFLLIISISTGIILLNVQQIITKNIGSELQNSSYLINSMIKTTVDTSIKTHLRTTSENILEITKHYYDLYKNNQLTEEEAKGRIIEVIKSLKIGTTGYMYILDSKGVLLYHPFKELQNTNLIENKHIQIQVKNKKGYIEYMWKNPDNLVPLKKAVYMSYFKPWDWILSASSYRSEFRDLVNLGDFEKQITKVKFGHDGYPVILDKSGTFLLHPSLKGHNLIEEKDPQASFIIEIVKNKNGIVEYDWKNPSETKARTKLTVYSELPEYNWIIASSAYKSDFYGSLSDLTKIILLVLIFSFIVTAIVTMNVSSMVTKPIKKLGNTVQEAVNGDLSVRVEIDGNDEITQLGIDFNKFIESLEINTATLNAEIVERCYIAKKLESLNDNLEQVIREKTLELKDAQNEVIQREKLVALNQLVKDIAHNINTPLGISITSATYIEGLVSELHDKYSKHNISNKGIESFFNEHDKSYELLISGLKRSASLIDMFKLITRDESSMIKESFNLRQLMKKCISMLNVRKNTVNLFCPVDIVINSNPQAYDLIVGNIINNALIHGYDFEDFGIINVNVTKVDSLLSIVIQDDGKGIKKEDLKSVFDPFYTNKSTTNSGLGLSIVYYSVKDILNGQIYITSNINSGTKVRLDIPIA